MGPDVIVSELQLRNPHAAMCYVCGHGTGVCLACAAALEITSTDVSHPPLVSRIQMTRHSIDLEDLKDLEKIPGYRDLPDDPPLEKTSPGKIQTTKKYHGDQDTEDLLEAEKEKIREVEATGFTVINGTDSTILLDLDSNAAVDRFNDMIDMVRQTYSGISSLTWWYSKSATKRDRRRHVVLGSKTCLNFLARMFLEAVLGSDPMRSILNVRKINFVTYPDLLFRPPGAMCYSIVANTPESSLRIP